MPHPPHLLLLPGLVCDAAIWKHQAHTLSGVTTVGIADYGSSDSLEKMARVAIESAPPRFALAGHSMGARVAFEIIRRVPERVVGLAILDSAYRPRLTGAAGERESEQRSTLLDLAQSKGMRAMALAWLPGIVHPARLTDQPLVDSIVEMICRKTPEIFAAQIRALLERPDAAPVLKFVRRPTLVLCGREDTWSPLAGHREMAALVPDSELVIIENSGHMSPMERPEDVTAAMTAWFARI
ncbi:MAG TPA: alpha/beta hydrolase [Candidatus Acidoferrales bacterium]|nr:alpha/beta hydrolase [Candidatus Acidoferrales bacterium]